METEKKRLHAILPRETIAERKEEIKFSDSELRLLTHDIQRSLSNLQEWHHTVSEWSHIRPDLCHDSNPQKSRLFIYLHGYMKPSLNEGKLHWSKERWNSANLPGKLMSWVWTLLLAALQGMQSHISIRLPSEKVNYSIIIVIVKYVFYCFSKIIRLFVHPPPPPSSVVLLLTIWHALKRID